MNSSALSMEISVAFVSWINDNLRSEIEIKDTSRRKEQRLSAVRRFVVAGVACISMALATIIAW